MRKTLSALAISGAMLASGSAFALSNMAGTYYMPLEFGMYHSDPTRGFNNSPFGSIGFGYNVNSFFALQANAGMMSPQNNAGQSYNGYLFDVEGKFSMPTQTNLMPYALVGAGYMQLVSKNPMADGGVGLAYALGPNLNADATYRLVYQYGQGKSDSIATLGLSFNFGGNQALPSSSTSSSSLTAQQQAELAGSQSALRQLVPTGVPVCTNGKMSPNQAGCVTFNGNVMTMHLNVKFDQNMAVIRPQYYGPISRLGDFMKAYPNTDVILYGYASSEGPLAFNQSLSGKRATVVQNYLISVKHIDASRISTKAMGISNPIADNSTNAGRVLNRRVEADVPVPVQTTP